MTKRIYVVAALLVGLALGAASSRAIHAAQHHATDARVVHAEPQSQPQTSSLSEVDLVPVDEDSPLWDCASMGNRICGTQTDTAYLTREVQDLLLAACYLHAYTDSDFAVCDSRFPIAAEGN